MTNDYDQIEEQLKEDAESKKRTHKVSGRTIFKLQEIIKEKAGKDTDEKETPQEEK